MSKVKKSRPLTQFFYEEKINCQDLKKRPAGSCGKKMKIMALINPYIHFNGNAEEADKYGIQWMVAFDPE